MIDPAHPLLLGSASPRRREILTALGLPLRIAAVDVDESGLEGEPPGAYLERIALAKLAAARVRPEAEGAGAILAADTGVILDGQILGKPRDEADARAMIRALAGREHEVWTRFAIAGPGGSGSAAAAAPLHAETVVTRVRFRALDEEEIADYAATGEGLDKAGAYAIQGVGAFAVVRIEGSYSNVVGLPVSEVIAALRRATLLRRFPLPRSGPGGVAPAPSPLGA
jgi:septum formation protein